ncbi:MAG: hypothetical protein KDK02_05760 [Rhodobacteraceae bacterium]|nr:hypothetical protein [Paracoccaceae bacterium]
MSGISSRPAPAFDSSAEGLRASARDLGEVLALLAGGVRPAPADMARLFASLRGLRGFLATEAEAGEGRHAHP